MEVFLPEQDRASGALMSSHKSSANEFPFQLVKTESSEGVLNVFKPLAAMLTGGTQRVDWMHTLDGEGPPMRYAIELPVEPSARPASALLQALSACFPAPPGVAEQCVSLAMFTGTGQCLLPPACLQDGQPCSVQQHLRPDRQWQQDTQGRWLLGETMNHQDQGHVVLQLVRWIQLDARALLNEHQNLLALHDIQKISLWRAGHDIRTPFNAVFGMLEMVLLGLMPKKTAMGDWSERLKQSRWYFEETIQDLLRTPTVSPNLATSDFSCIESALISARHMTQGMADEKFIRVHADHVSGQARIPLSVATEVFLNILGNAIKYSPVGHQIQISSFQRGEFIDISFVNDLIPGIEFQAPDLVSTQRHISAHANAGHGVGLATSVFLVHRHGGSIQQEQPQGQQCKTTIRLLAP